MKIETKYNIGDAVWVITNNKVHHIRIDAIEVSIGKATTNEDGVLSISEYKTSYSVGWGNWHKESDIFPTKEELLKSL